MTKYFIYIARTSRGNLYTGIAINPKKRLEVHNAGKGSKCLRGQLPVELVWMSNGSYDRSEASKHEYQIKQLTKRDKEELVRKHENSTRNP